MRDSERTVLVTGGAKGIGAAIVRRLVADGHPVAVNYLTSAGDAEALVREIVERGGRAIAVRGDVSDADDAARVVTEAARPWGPPLVLVNNAGLSRLAPARRQSPKDWDQLIGVNLSSAYYCLHAALPAMLEARWGRIVVMTSAGAERVPIHGLNAYAAAKAGLAAMARVIAKELAQTGITVNCVMPGFVDTDMTRAAGEAGFGFMRRNWPLVAPDSVAKAVAFLASDAAADISGEEIGVWRGGPSFRP